MKPGHNCESAQSDVAWRRLAAVLWAGALAFALLLAAMNLGWGALNQDEGWYLYAARLVAEGQRPYIDFASTQGPVMAHVYALANPLTSRWGVAGGRLFTATLGLLSAFSAALLAWRLAPPKRRDTAAFLAFSLVGVNVYQSYFTTIVKTYALAGLLLTLGFTALTFWKSRRGGWAAFGAGVLLALACGTRLSAGAVLPAAVAGFLWMAIRPDANTAQRPGWKRRVSGPEGRAAMALTLGFALTATIVFLPFALRAPQALWFALVEYHADRRPGNWIQMLAYKAGFVSRVTQAYFVALALGLASMLLPMRRFFRASAPGSNRAASAARPDAAECAVALGMLAITLTHWASPFPYDDYQTMAFPLFAALVAAWLARAVFGAKWSDGDAAVLPPVETARVDMRLRAFVFLLCIASAFSSPINQDWFLARRDRIWWPIRQETPLRRLQDTGRTLRAVAASMSGDMLLTQDTYLAVESGLRLPDGMALGPFSYFPDWPREKAETRNVMNQAMLLETIGSAQAPIAAFSGYGLAIRAPDIAPLSENEQAELWAAVEREYRLYAVVEDFGQAETLLRILVRREDSDSDDGEPRAR